MWPPPTVRISIISVKYCAISDAGCHTDDSIWRLSRRNVSLLLVITTQSSFANSPLSVSELPVRVELRNILMFKTRLFQFCSLEQICSLMMFSAIGSMFMFLCSTSRNNKTTEATAVTKPLFKGRFHSEKVIQVLPPSPCLTADPNI